MKKEINKALTSINYEIFIKKCVGSSNFERHKQNSDIMNLLLNTKKEDAKFITLFEQIQDNLVDALRILKHKNEIIDSTTIEELIGQINSSIFLEELLDCLDKGLNLFKK